MPKVTLEDAKSHLELEEGDDSRDLQIQRYIDAAQRYVVGYLRRDLDTEFGVDWPEDVNQAVRLIVANFFENREIDLVGQSSSALTFGIKDLLAPWRNLS